MFLRLYAALVFVTVCLPAALLRKVTGTSRFSPRAHRAPTAWEM
ncbi:hypothetical protein EDE04_3443 [Streptomyces sp. 2132.2]|nr:hypothetical protein [Streptomyces sp. 2132.2]ROQ96971.1 hypothetical protein EDE04_3443 [Streptomyces sp. 2132.2]